MMKYDILLPSRILMQQTIIGDSESEKIKVF